MEDVLLEYNFTLNNYLREVQYLFNYRELLLRLVRKHLQKKSFSYADETTFNKMRRVSFPILHFIVVYFVNTLDVQEHNRKYAQYNENCRIYRLYMGPDIDSKKVMSNYRDPILWKKAIPLFPALKASGNPYPPSVYDKWVSVGHGLIPVTKKGEYLSWFYLVGFKFVYPFSSKATNTSKRNHSKEWYRKWKEEGSRTTAFTIDDVRSKVGAARRVVKFTGVQRRLRK